MQNIDRFRIGECMGRLKIYKDNYTEATAVSNIFIDEYMKDANDAQILPISLTIRKRTFCGH